MNELFDAEHVRATIRADRLPHITKRVRQILRGDGYLVPESPPPRWTGDRSMQSLDGGSA
jgi:hypothetical protein